MISTESGLGMARHVQQRLVHDPAKFDRHERIYQTGLALRDDPDRDGRIELRFLSRAPSADRSGRPRNRPARRSCTRSRPSAMTSSARLSAASSFSLEASSAGIVLATD